MNLAETNRLLTFVAAVDHRHVDDATVLAWQGILGDLPLDDAIEAAKRHFANSTAYLMPAHVREQVLAIRRDRHQSSSDVLMLPSRFQVDHIRDERVRQGVAACVEVLTMANARRAAQLAEELDRPLSRSEAIHERALERARRERRLGAAS